MNILQIDQNVLVWLNQHLIGHSSALDFILKFLAAYLIYALPVVLLILWFTVPKKRSSLFLAVLGGALAWLLITKLAIPHIWLRPRPDLAAIGAKELLFHRPDYSFPSDHATMLFGLTFGLYLFDWKRAANWFLPFAIVVTFCRVVIGVHFPLDIIGGAVSGLIGALIVKWLDVPMTKYIYAYFLAICKFLRLA